MRGLVIGAVVLAVAGASRAEAIKAQTSSLDGGFRYEEVTRWATSDDIIQVRVSNGRRREVIDGNSLAVIRDGPWRGYLLVQRHVYHPQGGSYDPVDVVRPDGKVMLEVPGSSDDENSSAVALWLVDHHWKAW